MRKAKKGLEAAITTQHDDEKGLTSKDNGKIGLGDANAGALPPQGGSNKHRKNRRLDG
jgi:hypothetical protein